MSDVVSAEFTRAEAIAIREALGDILAAVASGVLGPETNWPITSASDAQSALERITAAIDYRSPAEVRAEWDAEHPSGTEVRYWRTGRDGKPDGVGCTRGPAYELIGLSGIGTKVVARSCVWVESKTDGFEGPIALTHVERRAS